MAETNVSGSPETKAKSYKCKDCKIKFPDVYGYTEHLESKAHIKGVMKNKYGEKYLEAKANMTAKSPDEKSVSDEKRAKPPPPTVNNKVKPTVNNNVKLTDSDDSSSSGEDEDVYPCNVCKKVCTGYLSYKLHLEGRKHNKMVQKMKLLSEMKKQHILPEPNDQPKEESLMDKIMPKNKFASSDIVCQVCNKSCTGPEVYKQHCKSKAHMKKLLVKDVVKGIDSLGLTPTPIENEESEKYHCKVCDKGFSGPIPYIQHLESTVHLKQAKQVEELDKIKDLIISSEEVSKFQCKECGKTFSGTVPFKDHLKSSIHGKMKKKSALLESLETKHPELFKGALGDEDSDSDILGCEVCHIALNGPEAARDHFSSLKHKKAVKKKALFQKYKRLTKQENFLETKPGKKQKAETGISKTSMDSDHSDSDEFDIISNPEYHDVKN